MLVSCLTKKQQSYLENKHPIHQTHPKVQNHKINRSNYIYIKKKTTLKTHLVYGTYYCFPISTDIARLTPNTNARGCLYAWQRGTCKDCPVYTHTHTHAHLVLYITSLGVEAVSYQACITNMMFQNKNLKNMEKHLQTKIQSNH